MENKLKEIVDIIKNELLDQMIRTKTAKSQKHYVDIVRNYFNSLDGKDFLEVLCLLYHYCIREEHETMFYRIVSLISTYNLKIKNPPTIRELILKCGYFLICFSELVFLDIIKILNIQIIEKTITGEDLALIFEKNEYAQITDIIFLFRKYISEDPNDIIPLLQKVKDKHSIEKVLWILGYLKPITPELELFLEAF